MTHTRGISFFIIVLLIILNQDSHAQPKKTIRIRKPAAYESSWIRNRKFPAGGIVLVTEGELQIRETPPRMYYQYEGSRLRVGAVKDALRAISDAFEHRETGGLGRRAQAFLGNKIQELRKYVTSFSANKRYRPPKMNDEGEYLERTYPQDSQMNEKKLSQQYRDALRARRKTEDVVTSRHELTKLLLYLIDHKIQITPIIRRTISYWETLLGISRSTNEDQAAEIADQPVHSQQPMGAGSHDAQSSQPTTSGNQDSRNTEMDSNRIVDPTDKPYLVSFYPLRFSDTPKQT